jgi:hypothetical protein
MSQVQAKAASMDFDQLLDCTVDDLPEFVGYKQMPVGLHTAYATLSTELAKDGKQFLKLALTTIETLEAPEGVTPCEPNEEYSFSFFTDTEAGIQRLGSAFKPYMITAAVPNFRALLEQLVGVTVAVKVGAYTSKPKLEGEVAKTYATLEEILPC